MRRLFVAATVCAVVLLIAVPAALAVSAPLHAAGHSGASARAPLAKNRMDRVPLKYEPLARRILIGGGTISLNVYPFNGPPEVGAEARWWVVEESDYGTGYGYTDADGHVDLTGVPAATASNGEITVFLDNPDNGMYDLSNAGWGASGWSGGLQPGQLPVTIVRSSQSGWTNWAAARVWLWAANAGGESHLARTDIARTTTATTTNGYARTITTGPESLTEGALYFWDDQGLELPVDGVAVSSGQEAAPGQTVYQSQAQRVWMDAWGSGKPGTRTWLGLNNYPSGWVNSIGRRRRLAGLGHAEGLRQLHDHRNRRRTTGSASPSPAPLPPGTATTSGRSTPTVPCPSVRGSRSARSGRAERPSGGARPSP